MGDSNTEHGLGKYCSTRMSKEGRMRRPPLDGDLTSSGLKDGRSYNSNHVDILTNNFSRATKKQAFKRLSLLSLLSCLAQIGDIENRRVTYE